MSGWTTDHEIAFLRRIGTFSERRDTPREGLLLRYLESAYRRVNWCGMDQAAILSHVRRSLESGA